MDQKLSLLVSHILDKQGYSEEMRQYRIRKFDEMNFVRSLCSKRTQKQHILAGSKAEGSSRHGESDYDYLKVYSGVTATECEGIVEGNSDLRLYMETDTAPAGYCRLQLLQYGNLMYRWFLDGKCFVQCPGYRRRHLSSTFVATMEYKCHDAGSELCGPASKVKQVPGWVEMDQVSAIRCSHPPHSFNLWFKRHIQAAWPTKQVMEQLANTHVFLVPVGKHGSDQQFLEWRISFNMAEKILLQNFTTMQYKIYILLKKIMKEVVSAQSPKSITSYIVKTIMLWAVEQFPADSWRNDQLLNILVHMIENLLRCVHRGVCSMYFIPEDNILEGRINEDTQQIVSDVLSSLLDDGCLCILKVPSIARQIYQFMYSIVPVPLHDHYEGTEWEKTNILMCHVSLIHVHSVYITDKEALLCGPGQAIPYKDLLIDLVSETKPAGSERQKFVKYFVSQTLSKLALQECVEATTQFNSNIQKYSSVRKCIRILHGQSHTDVLCGRLRLAQVFYMLGQHKAALHVLTLGADKVRYYMIKHSCRTAIQECLYGPRLATALGSECLSTSTVLTHFTLLDLGFVIQIEPLLSKALRYEVYKSCDVVSKDHVQIDPETLLFFLRWLCYKQAGETHLADEAFKKLVWCTKRKSNTEYREVVLNVVGHLIQKQGWYHQAARVLTKSIMLSKQYPHEPDLETNAAVWHLAILLNKQQVR